MAEASIKKFIENPAGLKEEVLPAISEMVEKYPYFNTAHFLKARVLKNINSEDFQNSLGIAAIYAVNRKKLYEFLNATYGENITLQETTRETKEVVEVEKEIAVEIKVPEVKEEEKTVVPEQKKKAKEFEVIDYSTTVTTEDLKDHIAQTVKRQLDAVSGLKGRNSEMKRPLYEPPVEDEKKSEDENYNADKKIDLLELDTNDKIPFTESKNEFSDDNIIPGIKKKPDQNTLIDNFIKTDPRIKMDEADKFEYEDISVSSIKEDDNLFTETLANIYIKQGNYTKAIFAFEKLILKYPEKKAYFASQIEKIRSKINN